MLRQGVDRASLRCRAASTGAFRRGSSARYGREEDDGSHCDENLTLFPASDDEELTVFNTAKEDWITRMGRQEREVKGNFYRRKADLFLSKTDPDASPMKRKGADHSHLGYPRLIAWST
jgi:hypothetical protein